MTEQGHIVEEFSYDLEDLLEQMVVETFPEIVEIGPVAGGEVW